MRQITAAQVTAMREVGALPDLLAAIVDQVTKKTRRHPNPDDLAADALAHACPAVPDTIRNGSTPLDPADVERIANAAASRAVRRALAQRHEDANRTASLDALAEYDPAAVEDLTRKAGETTKAGHALADTRSASAPRPDAIALPTLADAIDAALTVTADRATLAAAVAAYESPDYVTSTQRPSLTAALALAHAQTTGRKVTGRAYQRLSAQVTAALADVEPYAARILADPAERTTGPAPAWSAPHTAPRRPWTPQARAQADALALAARITKRDANAARKAAHTDAHRLASHVITRTAYGYDAALGYDTVRVTTAEGERLATFPADAWTPAHTALVLADLHPFTAQPLSLAEGIEATEATAGERAALFQPAAVRKPNTRKPSRGGQTGPTVPDRPTYGARAAVVEHPATAPAWQPLEHDDDAAEIAYEHAQTLAEIAAENADY